MNADSSSRRRFLLNAGALAAAAATGDLLPQDAGAAGRTGPRRRKTERVVLIAFAGGVRTRDYLGHATNAPNLARIAKAGVAYPNMRCANLGHFAAALSIFTGVPDYAGIRENERGDWPTVFEYLRKQLDLGPNDVWLSATGGVQQQNFAYSWHRNYGAKHGANLISSDGIFNAEFQKLLASFGKVRPPSEDESDVLMELRAGLDAEAKRAGLAKDGVNTAESLRSVEKFILDELNGGTSRITGPGAADAKTVRIASNLFRGFKPKVTGIVLQQADVAHGSYNAYAEVIRRNDEEIGRLWDAIQNDRALKDTTSVFIVPEFGRNKDLNERNGLDHGDGSKDLTTVGLIAAGPDFRPGQVLRRDAQTIDICPTVCELLGAKAEFAKGKILTDALG